MTAVRSPVAEAPRVMAMIFKGETRAPSSPISLVTETKQLEPNLLPEKTI